MAFEVSGKTLGPNPALTPFEVLLGDWQTSGSHPYLPGVVLHGRTSFGWLEGGAFLVVHSEIDNTKFPSGVEVFGSDDAAGTYYMLHFDGRGVSRKYDVSIEKNTLKWWRDDPGFSQRFTLTVLDNGQKLASSGEMRRDGAPWEKDLALTFTRLEK